MSGKKYEFHLTEPYFSLVCVRGKDIEGRVDDGDWKEVKEGDIITFYNNEAKKVRKVDARVVEKQKYNTFREMLKTEGLKRIFPNIDNIDSGVMEYYKTIQPSDEMKNKVSSVRFQVIEDYPDGWSNFNCVIS